MKKYLMIFLTLSILLGGGVVLASDEKVPADISINPDNILKNIKDFSTDIFFKIKNAWESNVWPWLKNLFEKFKSFFNQEKIIEEFKKETSELSQSLAEAGKYILARVNIKK